MIISKADCSQQIDYKSIIYGCTIEHVQHFYLIIFISRIHCC